MWFPNTAFHRKYSLQATSEKANRLTREVMLVQFQWICLKHILFIHDCLSRDLLFAKLEAYGLDIGSLNFLLDYLSLRNYRK